jgi:2-oxoglutarate/2-oxoacid ferredoxin oxidoreductase subunit alpha
MTDIVWKIGGPAGAGIMGAGTILGKAFTRSGNYMHIYSEYPSLVRGGHNSTQVRISDKKVESPCKKCDILVALTSFTVKAHLHEMNEGGVIINDENNKLDDVEIPSNVTLVNVPLKEIAHQNGGTDLMMNTVAMGASLGVMNYPFEYLQKIISETFERKGEQIVKVNVDCAKAGYDFVKSKEIKFNKEIKPKEGESKVVFNGNEAIGAGAIQGGLKLFSAYPMTPASSVLHFVASQEFEHNVVVKHCEDEIAAVLMAIGGSYAGARSMTSTSGGGFALMAESVGLSAITETPVTIIVAQRPGPSTGLPTWTEQGDFRFVLHSSQGDFLRLIVAPGDVAEAYNLTQKVMNLADKYQIPTFILSDKFLSESATSVDLGEFKKLKIDRGEMITKDLPELPQGERFLRYKITESGISPRPIPGVKGGDHVASSYEHWENGFSTEHFEARVDMVNKRERKIHELLKDIDPPLVHGVDDAEITLICWGSHKPMTFEAVDLLNAEGVKAKAIHFSFVHPLHPSTNDLLKNSKNLVIVENNMSSQFGGYLKEKLGVEFKGSILRFDGRQLYATEIYNNAKSILKGENKDVVVYDKEPYEYYSTRKIE